MIFESYKRITFDLFLAKLKDGESGSKFALYKSENGLLFANEEYSYDAESNSLLLIGIDSESNKKELISFYDNEDEINLDSLFS